MKLYFSATSPYVRKCLVCAHELGLADQLQLLPAKAHPIDRDQELIVSNPLGKVPTLITDDAQVLYDSRVICEYLNEQAAGNLLPATGPARWQVLTLQALGDGILDAALITRYEDIARPEHLKWPAWRLAQLDKATTSLSFLERHGDLLADRIDLGTITIGCALWYLDLRYAELGWRSRHPSVADWFESFSQRPSMTREWSR